MANHRSLSSISSSLAPNPRRGGLGRGLGALIPDSSGGYLEVDLERITPNPEQPRFAIDDEALKELVGSVREHGILQPLVVTHSEEESGQYTLIAGERRWRAARAAGLKFVPVVVKDVTPRQRLELALVENLQRQDLNPLETAQAYRQLVDEHGLSQDEVAVRVGKSRVAVANALRLLGLPPGAREALTSGSISEGHARAILSCPRARDRQALLQSILDRGLTVREAEEQARRLRSPELSATGSVQEQGEARVPNSESAPDLADVEERFRLALGTKVQIQRSRRGGRLVIHYYSDDQLQGLYEMICGPEAR